MGVRKPITDPSELVSPSNYSLCGICQTPLPDPTPLQTPDPGSTAQLRCPVLGHAAPVPATPPWRHAACRGARSEGREPHGLSALVADASVERGAGYDEVLVNTIDCECGVNSRTMQSGVWKNRKWPPIDTSDQRPCPTVVQSHMYVHRVGD